MPLVISKTTKLEIKIHIMTVCQPEIWFILCQICEVNNLYHSGSGGILHKKDADRFRAFCYFGNSTNSLFKRVKHIRLQRSDLLRSLLTSLLFCFFLHLVTSNNNDLHTTVLRTSRFCVITCYWLREVSSFSFNT